MQDTPKRRAQASDAIAQFLVRCANDTVRLEEMAKIAMDNSQAPKEAVAESAINGRVMCPKCRKYFPNARSLGQHKRRCEKRRTPKIRRTKNHVSPCGDYKSHNQRSVQAHQARCKKCASIRDNE